MKRLIMLLTVISLASVVSANCGNGNGNGNGCSGDTGPQGPAGQNGTNGTNGVNGSNGADGANGVNGVNGKDGRNGTDAQVDRSAKLALDAAVRLYDGKYIQLQAFNIYLPSRKDKQDVIGDGTNFMFGARIVFKLGSSYEERLLKAQDAKIKAMEAALSRLQN